MHVNGVASELDSFTIGLDNISVRLLKDSAYKEISASLTRLFNRSLESRTFPSIWKFGKVTALFKKLKVTAQAAQTKVTREGCNVFTYRR